MTMSTKIRTYKELSRIETYEDRYEYLKIGGSVGAASFGFDRYLNQALYRSDEWKRVRDKVIIRDNGCDMGMEEWPIQGHVIIHHMNPITEEDILNRNPEIFNPEYLICVSHNTHNAIHYGNEDILQHAYVGRSPGDTCPWR